MFHDNLNVQLKPQRALVDKIIVSGYNRID